MKHLKPSIFISGNCNAAVLRNALGRVGTLTDSADLFHVPNWRSDLWPEPMQDAFTRCMILILQTTNDAADFINWITHAAPKGCRVIRFPPAICSSLWPLGVNDPRNDTTRNIVTPEGLYPHCLANSEVLRLINDGHSPDSAAENYLTNFRFDARILDRFHELSISNQRAADRNGDLSIADYVDKNISHERLFIAPTHPGGPLFAELFRQLIRAIGLNPPSLFEPIAAEITDFIGVGAYDAPIHPQIVDHFKIQWAKNLTYRHFHEGTFSHDDYVRRYANLKYSPDYYPGFQLIGLGRPRDALPYLENAVQQNPTAPRFHEQLIRAAEGLVEISLKLQLTQRAVDLCPDDGVLWLLYAQAALTCGELQNSISAAEKAIARNVEPAHAWRCLATAYGLREEFDKANEATRQSNWHRSLPAAPRPLVESSGAEFGRWQIGFGADGF